MFTGNLLIHSAFQIYSILDPESVLIAYSETKAISLHRSLFHSCSSGNRAPGFLIKLSENNENY